ncbi:ABC transporter permease [Vibrio viridaestus]|nr:ABC transporter permease [Vibrio viridaestus]
MGGLTRVFMKRPDSGAIIGVIVIYGVFAIIDQVGWLNSFTQKNIFHFAAILGLMAIGQSIVMMAREIDISVGSVYGLSGISFIMFEPHVGVPTAVIMALGLAAVAGLLNAFFVLYLRLPAMIVTLGALFSIRGLIYVVSGGSVSSLDKEGRDHWLTQAFGGNWFGVENAVLWCLLVTLILSVVLNQTRFGNHLLAVGGDPASARSQGIRVNVVKTIAFVMCSVLAGFSAILTLADQPQTHVTLGQEQELEAIAAAVIGGIMLTGGRGTIVGALLGALIITAVRYELVALGAPSSWFITFVGVVLIASVIFNTYISRKIITTAH